MSRRPLEITGPEVDAGILKLAYPTKLFTEAELETSKGANRPTLLVDTAWACGMAVLEDALMYCVIKASEVKDI